MSEIKIRPGWIIRDLSTAEGGVTHDARTMRQRRVESGGTCVESRTSRTVDNPAICAALDALVKRVDYVLRKHCARATVGWFADDAALREVQAEVAKIQAEAQEVNARAAAEGSERRATIEIWPLRLDLAVTPKAPARIAGEIRQSLCEIRDAFREGRLGDLHKLQIRTRNLDKLVTGFPSEAIRFALSRAHEAAREARGKMRKGRDERRVGRAIDLDAIEAALACLPSDTASKVG